MIVVSDKNLYNVCRWVLLDNKPPAEIKAAAFEVLSKAFTHKNATVLQEKVPPPAWEEIVKAVREKQKILAIKLLREHTGMFLKDAKDAIEKEFNI